MCHRGNRAEGLEFLDFVKDGILEEVKEIFNNFPHKRDLLLMKDPDGKNCLHIAAEFGHEHIIEFLLPLLANNNISVDLIDNIGYTALTYACFRGWDVDEEEEVSGRLTCVQLLIDEGKSNPNIQVEYTKLTALHWTAFNNDKRVTKFLLERGAIPSFFSYQKETALDIAGVCENYQVVDQIISKWWSHPTQQGAVSFQDQPQSQGKEVGKIQPVTDNEISRNPKQLRLRFDTSDNSISEVVKYNFRILYWAAYIGRIDVVDHLLQQGYSPFMNSLHSQNAMMAAVDAKQIDIVKKILSYNYIPTNVTSFESSKQLRDHRGNNTMHHAFRVDSKEIKEELMNHKVGSDQRRNFRALLPENMCHKTKFGEEDNEPDYVFVVKTARADFFEGNLKTISDQIKIERFISSQNSHHTVLVVYTPDELLNQMAEIQKLQTRLLDYNAVLPFKTYAAELFEQFQAREKQFLMNKIFESEINIAYFEKVGIIVDHFPLHDTFKEEIEKSWNLFRIKLFFGFLHGDYIKHFQPITFVASYYGEKVGFYLAFLMFYTSWLLIPAIPGLALFIYQIIQIVRQYRNGEDWTLDTPINSIYCLVIAVWSTVVVEVWKRRESEIAHLWNMTNYQAEDAVRKEFDCNIVQDTFSRQTKKISFHDTNRRRAFTNPPFTIISIVIVCLIFWGYYSFGHSHERKKDLRFSLGATIVYACIIIVLQIIYRSNAQRITNFENHKYKEDWEDSQLIKVFCFQFVNAYIALFAYAFADQNFNQMAQSLAINLAVKQILMNFVDIYMPQFKMFCKKKKLSKRIYAFFGNRAARDHLEKTQEFVEYQMISENAGNSLIKPYSEVMIQFGYIVLFSPCFPLAPLFSIISNFIEIKGCINLWAKHCKRFPAEGASGIGNWKGIAEFLSFASIVVNCGIIYYTSVTIDKLAPDFSPLYKFMIIVGIEHVIIFLKLIISIVIADTPSWVIKERKEMNEMMPELFGLLDQCREKYKLQHGELMSEKIFRIKMEKQLRADALEKAKYKSVEERELIEGKLFSFDDSKLPKRAKKIDKNITIQEINNFNMEKKVEINKKKDEKMKMIATGIQGMGARGLLNGGNNQSNQMNAFKGNSGFDTTNQAFQGTVEGPHRIQHNPGEEWNIADPAKVKLNGPQYSIEHNEISEQNSHFW